MIRTFTTTCLAICVVALIGCTGNDAEGSTQSRRLQGVGCHPAYSPCLPDRPGNALNCSDLSSDQRPVTVLRRGVDPYRLDGDGDGIACEIPPESSDPRSGIISAIAILSALAVGLLVWLRWPRRSATETAAPPPSTELPRVHSSIGGVLSDLRPLVGRPRLWPLYRRSQFDIGKGLRQRVLDDRKQPEGWVDHFSGRTIPNANTLEVDHIVALRDAWRSGACEWSDAKRAEFATDPINLALLHIKENQRKSDYGPADYTPANASYIGPYLLQYAMVKAKWRLSVTRADYDAIEAGLSKHYPG